MPASPADSAIHARLFGDPAAAALFSDEAELRAMLQVEAALAEAQARHGMIPGEAAQAIAAACRDARIEPAVLSSGVERDGVPVPALLGALRPLIPPEHAPYLHWGATSQDIVDTALALRLAPLLRILDERLAGLAGDLGELAYAHADCPMVARTYGQAAVPTSFGAVVAGWGRPLLRHRERLGHLRGDLLKVSLSGAAGTLSVMGALGPAIRASLGQALDLRDPGATWHSERDGIGAFAGWMAGLCGSLGKMGEDLILLAQSHVAELRIAGGGGSSTMPQKDNPVGPSVLVALARTAIGLAGVLQGAGLHRQQRDGAAWFTEWLTLPQLCGLTSRGLALARDLAARITPDPEAMARNMEGQGGAIHAEAISFALARRMPRSEAQAAVGRLAREAREGGRSMLELARRDHPNLDWTGPDLGQAPAEARAFAGAAREGRPP